jgi:hypothetical protein
MVDRDDERRRRAEARASWPGRVVRLEDLPEVEVLEGDPAQLIAMVTELTMRAWALRGEPLPEYTPEYTRAEMPGRVFRGRFPSDDDEPDTSGESR